MKPVEVRFDESTYKEYLKLQKNVLENKKSIANALYFRTFFCVCYIRMN